MHGAGNASVRLMIVVRATGCCVLSFVGEQSNDPMICEEASLIDHYFFLCTLFPAIERYLIRAWPTDNNDTMINQ